ncbi:MAG: transposase zinc-binding domain-containing protein [Rubrivivax sp.]|nr:transposase zinc-binding domain-containing protein [Rubrivivax sp.]
MEQTEFAAGADLPQFVKDEFDAFLECGILAHGFLRLRCGDCGHDKLVAFSCKRRGFCPSCGARRMAQTAAHLVDHVIPHVPVRQWVLSLPIPLRLLLAAQPKLVTPVLQVVHRAITRFLLDQAGLKAEQADSGAVTLIQRFGSAANGPLQTAACTYRIAFGPRTGQKVLTVQGAMSRETDFKQTLCADIDGFSPGACIAPARSAGTRPLPGPCVRPHPARRRALRRRLAARRWSSCAATSRARHWPTNACKLTPRARWCSSSRPPGETALLT